MREENIEKMNFKELRAEVQYLRDELAIFKRKYEDAIYNLDSDNFGKSFTVEQNNMKAQIKITADALKTTVSKNDLETELSNYSTIMQTASDITAAVSAERTYVTNLLDTDYYTKEKVDSKISVSENGVLLSVSSTYKTIDDANNEYSNLSTSIEANTNKISAIVSGNYTSELLGNYLSGIVISPDNIKMVNNDVYSVYNRDGLRFYDSSDQIEGWAIEPDVSNSYGGVLNFYENGTNTYRFGTGNISDLYSPVDMSIKALNPVAGRFVVDLNNTGLGSKEVKFVGLEGSSLDSPHIYANDKMLATKEWVSANFGSGTVVAVFG